MKWCRRVAARIWQKRWSCFPFLVIIIACIVNLVQITSAGSRIRENEKQEAEVLITGETVLFTQDFLEKIASRDYVGGVYPVIRTEGTVDYQGAVWSGVIIGIDYTAADFEFLSSDMRYREAVNPQMIVSDLYFKELTTAEGDSYTRSEQAVMRNNFLGAEVMLDIDGVTYEAVPAGIVTEGREGLLSPVYLDYKTAAEMIRKQGKESRASGLLVEISSRKDVVELKELLKQTKCELQYTFQEEMEKDNSKMEEIVWKRWWVVCALLLSGVCIRMIISERILRNRSGYSIEGS